MKGKQRAPAQDASTAPAVAAPAAVQQPRGNAAAAEDLPGLEAMAESALGWADGLVPGDALAPKPTAPGGDGEGAPLADVPVSDTPAPNIEDADLEQQAIIDAAVDKARLMARAGLEALKPDPAYAALQEHTFHEPTPRIGMRSKKPTTVGRWMAPTHARAASWQQPTSTST